ASTAGGATPARSSPSSAYRKGGPRASLAAALGSAPPRRPVPSEGPAFFFVRLPRGMARDDPSYRASVLIVDDEAAIRESLRMILEFEGYRVEEAASGAQTLARVADRMPDAVVLDIKMPEMDGLELLKALRERGYEMPVLMISGHADVATAVEATRRGAYDFFEKPLERERVLLALRNATEAYRLQTEARRDGGRPVDELIGASLAIKRLRET